MLNRAEQDRCYARGAAAGSSLLALTVVELPKFRPNGLRMTLTSTVVSASGARDFWFSDYKYADAQSACADERLLRGVFIRQHRLIPRHDWWSWLSSGRSTLAKIPDDQGRVILDRCGVYYVEPIEGV